MAVTATSETSGMNLLLPWATRCGKSSICCAKKRRTTSRSTRRGRSSAGSSGAWRWLVSRGGGRYVALLNRDGAELQRLADDLFINVTRFFRDKKAFDLLAEQIVPEIVHAHPPDRPIRIWVTGCSTGEEAYSIAMLFLEAIAAARRSLKLQIFATDIDADAIAFAREGLYLPAIEPDVTPERLARFFTREDQHYRVSRELRATIVFSVHDVVADAPFSRLDLISCRNLLIYLRPEIQHRVLSLFHFALHEGGTLFLGPAETVGGAGDNFEAISQPQRIYRHIGHGRPGEAGID